MSIIIWHKIGVGLLSLVTVSSPIVVGGGYSLGLFGNSFGLPQKILEQDLILDFDAVLQQSTTNTTAHTIVQSKIQTLQTQPSANMQTSQINQLQTVLNELDKKQEELLKLRISYFNDWYTIKQIMSWTNNNKNCSANNKELQNNLFVINGQEFNTNQHYLFINNGIGVRECDTHKSQHNIFDKSENIQRDGWYVGLIDENWTVSQPKYHNNHKGFSINKNNVSWGFYISPNLVGGNFITYKKDAHNIGRITREQEMNLQGNNIVLYTLHKAGNGIVNTSKAIRSKLKEIADYIQANHTHIENANQIATKWLLSKY